MSKSFQKVLEGYQVFRNKYASDDKSVMQHLYYYGQQPQVMVVACCDSRVDPALILQCNPGDLFVVRNVANIIPPYQNDDKHHGTSAALEFGIRFLNVEHLIILGHSQCGGIQALINNQTGEKNDFISNWVSIINTLDFPNTDSDGYAKLALKESLNNCQTFPWIKEKVAEKKLIIHLWFFDILTSQIFTYSREQDTFEPLTKLMGN